MLCSLSLLPSYQALHHESEMVLTLLAWRHPGICTELGGDKAACITAGSNNGLFDNISCGTWLGAQYLAFLERVFSTPTQFLCDGAILLKIETMTNCSFFIKHFVQKNYFSIPSSSSLASCSTPVTYGLSVEVGRKTGCRASSNARI